MGIWFSTVSTHNGSKHYPESRVTWSIDISCLLLAAYMSPRSERWVARCQQPYNLITHSPVYEAAFYIEWLPQDVPTGRACGGQNAWCPRQPHFTVTICFILHWELTNQHSSCKYQVQCAKSQVSVPTRLADAGPGASHRNCADQPWGLLETQQEAFFPSYTPSLTLWVFKLGKLDAIKSMNTFLSSSLPKEYCQMNFLQNIIIGSRFINECNKYWVPYYMPATVLGVVEYSRLKRIGYQSSKLADQERRYTITFLRNKLF